MAEQIGSTGIAPPTDVEPEPAAIAMLTGAAGLLDVCLPPLLRECFEVWQPEEAWEAYQESRHHRIYDAEDEGLASLTSATMPPRPPLISATIPLLRSCYYPMGWTRRGIFGHERMSGAEIMVF